MRLTVYPDAAAFLRDVQEPLEEHEVANGLMLGLALRLAQGLLPPDPTHYFATVGDASGLVLAALMTPPHNLVVYGQRAALGAAPGLLLRDLLGRGLPVAGALGPCPVAQAIAEAWPAASGGSARPGMHQRVYELRQVSHPHYSPGRLRPAEPADVDLITAWSAVFHDECGLPSAPGEIAEMVQRRVAGRDIYLWEHGRPVALAARTRATRHGATVGLVYTPPELRRRGYATSCVAALSQHLLDSGYRFCTLFTDLANPTSNDIYQQIGYRPVCDFDEHIFL